MLNIDEAEARLARQTRRNKLMDASGIIGRYQVATFETFKDHTADQRRILEACRSFAENFRPDQGAGLFLVGPPGTGKSHLACAMVRAVIELHDLPAKIANARSIIRRLRATWRAGADEAEADVLEHLGRVPLLVIDEVGVGFGSEAERVQMLDLIDARYRLQHPTVVASNVRPDSLRDVLGDRAFDRLREGAKTLVFSGASHRGSVPHTAEMEFVE